MGLAPDITELKNPYASGTKWKASGASMPAPYTQFKPNRNRRDPMFEMSWRDKVYAQDPRVARVAAERASSQAKLEAQSLPLRLFKPYPLTSRLEQHISAPTSL